MDPKPKYLDEAFRNMCEEITELFVRKHHDYGKSNILEIEEIGIAIRITEKLSRLKHLLSREEEPSNESLEDSWKDIAVYAVIALLYRRGLFQKLDISSQKTEG